MPGMPKILMRQLSFQSEVGRGRVPLRICAAGGDLLLERPYRTRELVVQPAIGLAMNVKPAPQFGIATVSNNQSFHAV